MLRSLARFFGKQKVLPETPRLLALRAVSFRCRQPNRPALIPLSDLKPDGMRLGKTASTAELASVGSVSGELVFEWKTCPVSAELAKETESGLEFRFVGEVGELRSNRERYFSGDPASAGWTEFPPELLNEELAAHGDGTPHFLTHPDGRELYLVVSPVGRPTYVTYSANGLFLQAEVGRSKWGQVEKGAMDANKPKHRGSKLVERTGAPPQELIAEVMSSILGLPHLTFQLRNLLGDLIRQGVPKWKV